jgi:hypothetical protein
LSCSFLFLGGEKEYKRRFSKNKKLNPINGVEKSCGRKQSLPIKQTRRASNEHNLLL